MKKTFYFVLTLALFSSAVFAQQGIDPQTQKIKQEGTKTTQTNGGNIGNVFSKDWGKGKTKVREMLSNPYKINARRDVLVENALDILKDRKLLVNESASRIKDGFIVTEPFIFAKGAVIARSDLNRYSVLPDSDTSWTGGRYTLTIDIQSIDGIQNNVAVTAKIEGKSKNGLSSEWTTLQSTGAAEDEFLAKLVELLTGKSVDPPQDSQR